MSARIQLVPGTQLPFGVVDVTVDRYANPYRPGMEFNDRPRVIRDHAHAVEMFRKMLVSILPHRGPRLHELRGQTLGCTCPAGEPCHGDVWLDLANWEAA